MLDLIQALTGDLWGYVAAAGGIIAAVLGVYFKGRADHKAKVEAKNAKDRLKTIEEVKDHENQAKKQSDKSLVDRLSGDQ